MEAIFRIYLFRHGERDMCRRRMACAWRRSTFLELFIGRLRELSPDSANRQCALSPIKEDILGGESSFSALTNTHSTNITKVSQISDYHKVQFSAKYHYLKILR